MRRIFDLISGYGLNILEKCNEHTQDFDLAYMTLKTTYRLPKVISKIVGNMFYKGNLEPVHEVKHFCRIWW